VERAAGAIYETPSNRVLLFDMGMDVDDCVRGTGTEPASKVSSVHAMSNIITRLI